MSGIGRTATRTCALLAIFAFTFAVPPASADETLDTSKLPRVDGTKDIFASPPSTIFTAPQPVAETADGTVKALTGAGWQQYAPAFTEQAKIPNMFLASFKKGPVGLSIFINVAPAQGNATSVTYTGVALANDLPFPKDATEIKFDADRPHLECVTAGSAEATSDFFRTELIARGWSPWSEKQSAKAAYADQKTEKGLYAYYVRDPQKPLLLTLENGDGGKTIVKLESVPAELLVAADKGTSAKEPQAAAAAPEAKPADKIGEAFDAIANDIMKQAQQATSDALAGVNAPPAKSESEGTAPESELTTLAGNSAPIPLPSTAEDVEYDSAAGRLEFNSASSVKQVAAFYRAQMAPLGWTEQKSVINRDNMVALEFHKGEEEISLTVLKMGTSVNVSANGSALEKEAAAPQTSEGEPSAGTSDTQTSEALEAEDAGGLPVPKQHTLSGSETSMFRHGANANVPAKLDAVLAFYRAELGKRADWKEDTAHATIKADAAELHYATAEGPAVLKLGRANGETTIELVVREQDKAMKSGIMPKPGQVKLLFGNVLDKEAVITINKKAIKVPGGAGSKAPDGPTLEVPPGKYAYTLKGAGGHGSADPVQVGADEIWGIMIGPGGVLPLQMY